MIPFVITSLLSCSPWGWSSDKVLNGHVCSHSCNNSLVNNLDLLVELGTLLVLFPSPQFPFILQLSNDLTGPVGLLAGSVSACELAFADKVGFMPTLQPLALLGNEIALGGNTCKLEKQ